MESSQERFGNASRAFDRIRLGVDCSPEIAGPCDRVRMVLIIHAPPLGRHAIAQVCSNILCRPPISRRMSSEDNTISDWSARALQTTVPAEGRHRVFELYRRQFRL